ncbi:unnamed protein product [Paramecium octaurelia]|uniref:Uncharacterized protein n=1 Tax=Paramecium octaurelia TaxID=43137 RepID=A0A8S1YBA6_PAROT|nr:unnamed protein product [Paramecium octaurelia]
MLSIKEFAHLGHIPVYRKDYKLMRIHLMDYFQLSIQSHQGCTFSFSILLFDIYLIAYAKNDQLIFIIIISRVYYS